MKPDIGRKVFYPGSPPRDYLDAASSLGMRPGHFSANAADIRGLRPSLLLLRKRWQDLKVPAAIVAGDSDLIAPLEIHARPLAQALPKAKLIEVANTGHQPFFSAPEKIFEAIEWVWKQV